MKTDKYIIYNLPLRGDDTPPAWNNREMAWGMKRLLEKHGIAGTWLPRYDALCDPEYIELCKGLDKDQELGVWLEITSSHCREAGIPFKIRQGEEWFWAKYCLTMGYSQKERKLLIDVIMKRYRSLFRFYPKTVSMWMIDSFSAQYLAEKYKVRAIGLCRNQFGIDGYTLWGGWPNLPFRPSRRYIWQPAQSKQGQGKEVIYPVITEDLTSNYGNEKGIWSTEVAMIQQRSLKGSVIIGYINKLTDHALGEKPVGLASFVAENGWDWKMLAAAYEEQIACLAKLHKEGRAESVTASEFSKNYLRNFSAPSPAQILYQPGGWRSSLKNSSCVVACTPYYRARLRHDKGSAAYPRLTDLRVYDIKKKDPYWSKKAEEKFARWIIPYLLDSSRFRLDRKDDNPVVDIDENKPMHFSIFAVPGTKTVSPGKLFKKNERVFIWKDKNVEAEWIFKDKEILVSAKTLKKNIAATLRFTCAPKVLKLGIVRSRKIITLGSLKPGVYNFGKIVLVNLEADGGKAAVKISGAKKGGKLIADWNSCGTGSVLSISDGKSKALNLRLKPFISSH